MKRSRQDLVVRKKSSPAKLKTVLSPEEIAIVKKAPSKLNLKKLKIKPKDGKELSKSKETIK